MRGTGPVFDRFGPATGRPAYDPETLLKLYLYSDLEDVVSSQRLEHKSQRSLKVMWLIGLLARDLKTIANFERDSEPATQAACRRSVAPS